MQHDATNMDTAVAMGGMCTAAPNAEFTHDCNTRRQPANTANNAKDDK